MYGEQKVVRLLDEDQKLFSSRESAKKFAKTVNVLRLAGINEISQVIPAELVAELVEEKRANYKGVKAGRFNKYTHPNNQINVDNFKSLYLQPEYKIEKGTFDSLGKYGNRNSSGFYSDSDGRVFGSLGKKLPLGLYGSEFNKNLRDHNNNALKHLDLLSPKPNFGRRTNYGFSRYF